MALQIEQLEKEPANRSLVNVGLGLYALIFGLVIIGLPILGQYFVGNSALGYLLPMSFVLLVLLIRLLQKRTGINQLYQHIAILEQPLCFYFGMC